MNLGTHQHTLVCPWAMRTTTTGVCFCITGIKRSPVRRMLRVTRCSGDKMSLNLNYDSPNYAPSTKPRVLSALLQLGITLGTLGTKCVSFASLQFRVCVLTTNYVLSVCVLGASQFIYVVCRATNQLQYHLVSYLLPLTFVHD